MFLLILYRKDPESVLTSPGGRMPVGLTIEVFQLMTSWVKAERNNQKTYIASAGSTSAKRSWGPC